VNLGESPPSIPPHRDGARRLDEGSSRRLDNMPPWDSSRLDSSDRLLKLKPPLAMSVSGRSPYAEELRCRDRDRGR